MTVYSDTLNITDFDRNVVKDCYLFIDKQIMNRLSDVVVSALTFKVEYYGLKCITILV